SRDWSSDVCSSDLRRTTSAPACTRTTRTTKRSGSTCGWSRGTACSRYSTAATRSRRRPPASARSAARPLLHRGRDVSTVGTETTLPDAVRTGVRDLVLVLADSKRLLGMRYAEWMLGAPELEASIACSSMAQDEWGHARLLYALLRDFGDDVAHLEHGREAHDYCNIEVLDRAPGSWPGLVALNALV